MQTAMGFQRPVYFRNCWQRSFVDVYMNEMRFIFLFYLRLGRQSHRGLLHSMLEMALTTTS